MKRCLAVTLVLMGGVALTACGDSEVDTAVFKDVNECISSGIYPADQCQQDFKEATTTHLATAPAYANKEDCEAEFGVGKCEQNSAAENGSNTTMHSGMGSFFMPLMMGYMMGSMFNSGQRMAPQSLYQRSGSSSYVNSNGATVANQRGATRLSSSSAAARAPETRTKTMARGGFGSRASAISS
ncbi:DUF1190 domain-containing protein [Bartonella sp. HY329]|uniref:DUF1190 domain-containing protein n=1 Tax=unclassified Bartonella TaxID=2645622 RepID=UPI0021C6CF4A|nr:MULTISPECIES: DUF1190 domain-containing protein [unclassified Bartonella]UXM95760.1 DUF1190 domain-containing protein [Bartonella sp. HY329]UXN10085.1 DUF1190 domain-containing protein [Bartonella sp. HY328]